ncbi:MAG TPA: SDR family oxidoreductase [Bryobacteraceae bacterium]|nr:SDR family oxidoreductase [Bryobacteraceae bacterium]
MESLAGKVAVVTGGTRGIGRAIVERLLGEGARVAFCGRGKESVDAVAGELARARGDDGKARVRGHAADVTDPAQVRTFFEFVDRAFGGLDILVNNAGAGIFRKVGEMSVEDWRRNIDLNLNAAFYCSREALPRFAARGGGFIVNISSLAGKNAFAGGAGYNASKAGLNNFSEALLLDHRNDNVRVSYIMPGSVDTGFSGGPSSRAGDRSWMIAPADVAEVAAMVLRMPQRTMVSRVEMRPSRPPK